MTAIALVQRNSKGLRQKISLSLKSSFAIGNLVCCMHEVSDSQVYRFLTALHLPPLSPELD